MRSRRRTLRIVAAVAVAALAGAVGFAAASAEPWRDRPLPTKDLSSEVPNLHIGERAVITFRDGKGLSRYLERRFGANPPRIPRIDFDREMITIVAMGPRSTSGNRVVVERVVERRNRVQVQVRELTPPIGRGTQPQLNYPQAVIRLPNIDKSVQLKVLEPGR